MRCVHVVFLVPAVVSLACWSPVSPADPGRPGSPAALKAAYASQIRRVGPDDPDSLVRGLRAFPASLPAGARSDGSLDPLEARRLSIYQQLARQGALALPALRKGFSDPDVQVRRNVALFLAVEPFARSSWDAPPVDIAACLDALVAALQDQDDRVRHLSAQAIGNIGPKAASAVPALIALLQSADEGSRNTACIGLAGIGPAAAAALPALRLALSGPSADVREFAARALERIEQR